MCVERSGEEKTKLEDTKPFEKDLRYPLNNVNNDENNEQKPRIPACGFYRDDRYDSTLLQDKESSSDCEDEVEEKARKTEK